MAQSSLGLLLDAPASPSQLLPHYMAWDIEPLSCGLQPEFSHNVQTYDKSVYLRVSDAQRCRVHSTMLLPLYVTAQREHPFAVFEVCQTETNVLFPSMVDLLQRCLEVRFPTGCSW